MALFQSKNKMARERDGRSRDLSQHDRDRDRDRRAGSSGANNNMTNHTSSSDPKLLMSRVFIGKLPTDRVCRGDLEGMFSKYGKILGKFTWGWITLKSCEYAQLCIYVGLFINACKRRVDHTVNVNCGSSLLVLMLFLELGKIDPYCKVTLLAGLRSYG